MTLAEDETSPRPWALAHLDDETAYLYGADGVSITYEAGEYAGGMLPGDADLIVTAVNEHDRLAGIVRNVEALAEGDGLCVDAKTLRAILRGETP